MGDVRRAGAPRTESGIRRIPDEGTEVDLEAHVALVPAGATVKGMFFSNFFDKARDFASAEEIARRAGVPHRRYVPFFDYPFVDNLRIGLAASQAMYPAHGAGRALRLLGATTYEAVLGTHLGRVIFAVLGLDIEAVLMAGPRAYKLAVSIGEVKAIKAGPRYVRYEYRDFPSFIETQQVGVIEGAMQHYRIEPRLEVEMSDLANGTIHVTW